MKTSRPQGLTISQARSRLKKHGLNKLDHHRRISAFKILLAQFTSPLIFILIIAALVTLFYLNDRIDTIVIGITIVVNTILGFIQEFRAEKSLEALQNMLTPKTKVIRGGQRKVIPAENLVPGDLVILEIGRTVPADGIIVQADSLSVNEAILTGESVPVDKQPENLAAMGTTVATGIGRMLVTDTGIKTRMGQIAASLKSTKEVKTPLQQQVAKLSKFLGLLVAAIVVIIFLVGLFTGRPGKEMFELSVAIAVSAIPEGLAVSLTVILAIGMQRILKKRALVRKLMAAETLGSVTVICADKTGTLTLGKMRVTGKEFTDEKLGDIGLAVCNDLRDPLEIAMSAAVPNADQLVKAYPRSDEIPFSPDYKYIATAHPSRKIMFVSGAPEILLEKSTLSQTEKNQWLKKFQTYGRQGLRLVSVAYKPITSAVKTIEHRDIKDLTWLGIVIFEDPVREGVAEALKKARQLGLKIKVITGDYRETAQAVLNRIGVPDIELFARVKPGEKLNIVQRLQKQGEVVAMTGDGVNDAPALKAADIGIVVEDASDVSKQTADMILLDNNFATIIAAIEEGRGMFANLKKIILYLLADAFSEVVLVISSLIAGIPLPITASQILWVNLVDDGLPNFALALEPRVANDLLLQPRRERKLIDKEIKVLIGLISAAAGIMSIVVFWWLLQTGSSLALARTVIFAMLGVDSLLYVFSCKTLTTPLWKENLINNKWLIAAVAVGFSLQISAIYWGPLQRLLRTVALGTREWGIILVTSFLVIALIEMVKWVFLHKQKLVSREAGSALGGSS